jgi:hypothetical protein
VISRRPYDDGQAFDADDNFHVAGIIASGKPGRYYGDEIGRDPLPSGLMSRRWGVGIKRADGTVTSEPDPWTSPSCARLATAAPPRHDGTNPVNGARRI